MPEKKYITLEDTARLLSTTPLNVLMHVKRGLLAGVEENGSWMIDGRSLEIMLKITGGSKAEGVCASGCAGKHACSGGCS
jgi:hypothetical protein